jgi:hypothetical protein
LKTHRSELVALDYFPVPTIGVTVHFVPGIVAHARRTVVHFHGTAHPTAQWTAQHLGAAFPWETCRSRKCKAGDSTRPVIIGNHAAIRS